MGVTEGSTHLVVGVLDDPVERRDQVLLLMEAARVAGDLGVG